MDSDMTVMLSAGSNIQPHTSVWPVVKVCVCLCSNNVMICLDLIEILKKTLINLIHEDSRFVVDVEL